MKAKKTDNGYFLRIDKGEEIISTITSFIISEKIQSGTIAGIGALTNVTLGYFNRHNKQYNKQVFDDVYELLSLNGNISYISEEPIVHVHCVLGDADYQTIGGHLFSGTVAVTGEVFIRTFQDKFNRKLNDDFNLNLLDI